MAAMNTINGSLANLVNGSDVNLTSQLPITELLVAGRRALNSIVWGAMNTTTESLSTLTKDNNVNLTSHLPISNATNITISPDQPYQWASDLFFHLNWMCPASCGYLVLGMFGNLVVAGVLQHRYFAYMKLPIYMVIYCVISVCLLLIETLKIFSCLIDSAQDKEGRYDPSLYTSCVYISWLGVVLEFSINGILVFTVHNRFKAIGSHDNTSSRINAKRVPVIIIMALLILSIIPASIYKDTKMKELKQLNTSRCSHLFLFPYSQDYLTDQVISVFPLLCQVSIVFLLVCIFVRVAFMKWHTRLTSRGSLAFTLADSTFTTNEDDDDESTRQHYLELAISSSGNLNKMTMTTKDLNERDRAMTQCVLFLVFGYLAVSIPRSYKLWPHAGHKHESAHDHDIYILPRVILQNVFLAFFSSVFFVFLLGSRQFQSIVHKYYHVTPMRREFYTDLALAARMSVLKDTGESSLFFTDGSNIESKGMRDCMKSYVIENFESSRDELRLDHVKLNDFARRRSQRSTRIL